MPGASTQFHESEERLSAATRDMHRALVSLMEELEAIDWYTQRIEASEDRELAEVLRHSRDEEVEHAVMTLEWIRRRSPEFDRTLRERLFAEGSIVAHEEAIERGEVAGNGSAAPRAGGPHVTVGSLRERR
jgi:ferritin-like protein